MSGSAPTFRSLRSHPATGLGTQSAGSETTLFEPIGRMWEIASLLNEHGVPIRMLRSANPGKIFYQDSCQIVVEEWKKL